jgi:hypothetical protein
MPTTNEKQLSKVEAAALAKAAKKIVDASTGSIAVGKHTGMITVRVAYDLNKAEDYDTAPTVNLLSKAVLAKALVMSGIQADNFLGALRDAAVVALNAGEKAADILTEEDNRVLAKMDALFNQVIAELPRQTRAGSTTGKVRLEVLDSVIIE